MLFPPPNIVGVERHSYACTPLNDGEVRRYFRRQNPLVELRLEWALAGC
jgi:hypothetical protein